MLGSLIKELRPALALLATMTILTGVAYPLAVWGVSAAAFGKSAGGSLATRKGAVVGSELMAQKFESPRYFWSRPSAADYNGGSSSGSNLAPSNPALTDAIRDRIEVLRASDPGNKAPIPMDLVTTSGSGLDPHLSVEGALWQAARIARERSLPEDRVKALIAAHTEDRTLGFLGEPRVNVLSLNLSLDEATGG